MYMIIIFLFYFVRETPLDLRNKSKFQIEGVSFFKFIVGKIFT